MFITIFYDWEGKIEIYWYCFDWIFLHNSKFTWIEVEIREDSIDQKRIREYWIRVCCILKIFMIDAHAKIKYIWFSKVLRYNLGILNKINNWYCKYGK